MILSLPDAEALARDLRRRITERAGMGNDPVWSDVEDFMLTRVESDLAGLRHVDEQRGLGHYPQDLNRHARRYSDGLRATAALYRVECDR